VKVTFFEGSRRPSAPLFPRREGIPITGDLTYQAGGVHTQVQVGL